MNDLPEKIHLMKEAQADANGVRWAAQAGYDPKGSLRAMAALKVPGRSEAAYASAGYWSPEKRIQWLRHLIAAEKLEHTHVTP